MTRLRGLTVLDEREGTGPSAQKGQRVLYNMRLFLKRGDEVPLNEAQLAHLPHATTRLQDGVWLLDRTVTLGRREVMAGIERALMGMKVGGYRKVRISPHLAYRDQGLPGLIPADAVLIGEFWLRGLDQAKSSAIE